MSLLRGSTVVLGLGLGLGLGLRTLLWDSLPITGVRTLIAKSVPISDSYQRQFAASILNLFVWGDKIIVDLCVHTLLLILKEVIEHLQHEIMGTGGGETIQY